MDLIDEALFHRFLILLYHFVPHPFCCILVNIHLHFGCMLPVHGSIFLTTLSGKFCSVR